MDIIKNVDKDDNVFYSGQDSSRRDSVTLQFFYSILRLDFIPLFRREGPCV